MASTDRERGILASLVFAVLFSQVLLYPGAADLVTYLGAEPGASSVTTSTLDASMWFFVAEFAGYVIAVGLWGLASDRAGRRVPLITTGALVGALGYLLLAAIGIAVDLPFEVVLLLRFFQGSMTIGAFSLTITMLMDLPGGHGRNMGAAGIAIGFGAALGAPIGGQLTTVTPVAPLVVAGGLLVGVGLLISRVTDRAPSERRTGRAIVQSLSRRPVLAIPYVFGFVDRLTAGFFALVGTAYFREAFSLDAGQAGLLLACFFVPFALLQYPMGIVSDRIGRTIPIVVGSLCYGLGIIAVGSVPTVLLAAGALVAVGILGSLVAPATMALVTDIADSGQRGVAMAGFNLAGSLGFLGGFLVGGGVATAYGYDWSFLTVGGLEILIAALGLPLFLRLSIAAAQTGSRGR